MDIRKDIEKHLNVKKKRFSELSQNQIFYSEKQEAYITRVCGYFVFYIYNCEVSFIITT